MSLKDHTLFITGASRGIGLAIALRAARDGANIAIAAKTDKPHPKLTGTIFTTADEITKAGGKALPLMVDVRDEAQVKDAIEQTVIAASSDEGRPVLTGVYVHLNGGKATFAATDGHRLAVKTLAVQAEPGEGETIVIPARALSELSRILKTGDDGVEVTVGAQKNQVFFKTRDVELMSRLIEGTYPNYQQVIPGQSTTTITSKTQDLLFTTKMVSLFSKDAANVVKFKAEGGKLTLTANTSEVGQNVAGVEAKIEGQDLQVAFNSKYLLDVLAIIGSEEVQLGFTGPLNPGLIKPVGKDNYLYIIMPVRVAM